MKTMRKIMVRVCFQSGPVRVAVFSLATIALSGVAGPVHAQTFKTLYNLTGGSDGAAPYGGLIKVKGSLYGAAYSNASGGPGTVFKVNSSGHETTVYTFKGKPDGAYPHATLVRDSKGNLYGTTYSGGTTNNGTVFKISPNGKESVLYSFAGGTSDGCAPYSVLLLYQGGLYGTANACGTSNLGIIFRVTTAGKETVLHSFAGAPSDGSGPYDSGLVVDKSGTLYGFTPYGGASNMGALYKMTTKNKITLLYSFAGGTSDGCYPNGTPTFGKGGLLYGATLYCGTNNDGTIMSLTAKGKETVLHTFAISDGVYPWSGVGLDAKGNIYGVTTQGGADKYGTVYELSSSGTLTVLHNFDISDGLDPFGQVLVNSKGDVYGTTVDGGTDSYGTVWTVTQ